MIKLRIVCPHCGRSQVYVSYKTVRREQVFKLRRSCVWCNRSFGVRENIAEELEFVPYISNCDEN